MKTMKRTLALLLTLCMVLALFPVAAFADALTPPVMTADSKVLLRQTADWSESLTRYTGAACTVSFTGVTDAWVDAITSIKLTPVDKNGDPTVIAGKTYPNAPKEITFTQADRNKKWIADGEKLVFYRTAEEPVVYVADGHEPIEIVGRWSTITYPQSQIYDVEVTADGYADVTGSITYYTGTAPAFSIIEVDEDGKEKTVKEWSAEEIKSLSTFANGSSQCGMTGFRSFSGEGVSLRELLEIANVEVSEDDYFLLDTSDHYGNNFTYEQLFGTTRYFLESIYTDEVKAKYAELVQADNQAGATLELRKLLAEKALQDESIVEPRINVNYDEKLISGEQVQSAVLPTAENTTYSELVVYENRFRFFYGIALEGEGEATVSFDTQGGSAVEDQFVKTGVMTSTENTTIKSSYWANSLVIYRGQGKEHPATTSGAADKLVAPKTPTRAGYVFDGWYTDAACTAGNKFDFDDVLDGDTEDFTLYAKWVEEKNDVDVVDCFSDVTNILGKDAVDGISYVYNHEPRLMDGVTAASGSVKATFAPNATADRAMVVTVLWRLAGEPTNFKDTCTFNDITLAGGKADYYTTAAKWAYAMGITTGRDAAHTVFDPHAAVTREELAAFFSRYVEQVEGGSLTGAAASLTQFADGSDVGTYAAEPLKWATGNGIIRGRVSGNGQTVLSARDTAKRSEMAIMLMRFCNLITK